MQAYIESNKPKLAFDAGMEASEFPVWREKLRTKVLELMAFPDVPQQPEPKRIAVEQRDGYQLQRWEAYAEPYSAVPSLMLLPDGASARTDAEVMRVCNGLSIRLSWGYVGEFEFDANLFGFLQWRSARDRPPCTRSSGRSP